MSGDAVQWSTHIFCSLSLLFCVPHLLSRLLTGVGGGGEEEKKGKQGKRKEGKKAAKLLNNKGITFFWNINFFSLFH